MGSWVRLEATVATSHPVEKYDGVAASRELLQQMVELINDGGLPMVGHHDSTRPVRTKDVVARLIELDDGEVAVRVSGFVDQGDWDALGQVAHFSFTGADKIGRAAGPNPDADPLLLSADAAWFDDEAILGASALMSEVAPVDGARLYQFDAYDTARVILDLGSDLVGSLGPNLAASAIWDGLKFLLTRRKSKVSTDVSPTRIELRTNLDSGEVVGIIDSSDESVVKRALDAYSDAVDAAAAARKGERVVVVWTTGEGSGWKQAAEEEE